MNRDNDSFVTGVAKYSSLFDRRVLIRLLLTIAAGFAVMVLFTASDDLLVSKEFRRRGSISSWPGFRAIKGSR